MSVSKGFVASLEEAVSIGRTAMQIFAKSPMSASFRKVTAAESKAFAASPVRGEMKSLVIHASYLLNFAKPLSKDAYELRSVAEDLENSDLLGGDGVVLHMGKALKEARQQTISCKLARL